MPERISAVVDLATRWAEARVAGDTEARRAMVVSPEQGRASGLGQDFVDYAGKVQTLLDATLANEARVDGLLGVGEPSPIFQEGEIALFGVPLYFSAHGRRIRDRVLVYRLGEELGIGFAVPAGEGR